MAVSISDKVAIKRLVTAGNDEIWYEDLDVAAGTMTELDTSGGAIDTSDQLNMVSAFQKAFIANGANLKVADFVNTKLTIAALTTAPTRGSIVTQASSTATMIVDYVNSAKTAIYGYVTSGTFNTTNTLSGGGMSPEDKVPSAVTSNPHWYDWQVYLNDTTTYGTMPDKSYLISVYRGRMVLSGNPEYPHQWYMSKVADPFNFLYGADDPMSAVAGNNADAGQCSDIIRCLISFHDDYLIFGATSTIWVLRGDPVAGGSLDNLSDTTGIFGANSWCFDENRNLYFWGSGGIYVIKADFSGVKNLTAFTLPDIINDEAADPSTHRITMGYDKKRHGLVIAITLLSDGSNSNYFYSFKTQGFYPESYPDECGPYSLFYYDANDTTFADLLVGCKDGYIRKYLNTAKDDDVGASDDAISSYVTYPITALGDVDINGRLGELIFDLAGGASGGDFTDTDGVSYELHKGDDAETVLEDIIDGATAFASGTLSGTGRKNKIRPRMRGVFMGLKLYNSTASESWAINRVLYSTRPVGRIK